MCVCVMSVNLVMYCDDLHTAVSRLCDVRCHSQSTHKILPAWCDFAAASHLRNIATNAVFATCKQGDCIYMCNPLWLAC